MSYNKSFAIKPLALFAFAVAAVGCSEQGPPAKAVSYAKDVKPMMEKHCFECHTAGGTGKQKSGFDMGSYENLMKGTKFGPVVVAGDSVSHTRRQRALTACAIASQPSWQSDARPAQSPTRTHSGSCRS